MNNVDLNHALMPLVGRELSSVEFVQDYLQLRFDGLTITAYNAPELDVAGNVVLWKQKGYCDLLCSHIGNSVVSVEPTNDSLLLRLTSGLRLCIRFETAHQQGPEAFEYVDLSGRFWIV